VQSWRFFGAHNVTGPWIFLDQVNKTGFETEYNNASFYLWARAEAVDKDGAVLGGSEVKYTFVPSSELRDFCQDETCVDASGFGFPGEEEARPLIPPAGVNTVPWVDPEHDGITWTYPSGFPHTTEAEPGTDAIIFEDRWSTSRKRILSHHPYLINLDLRVCTNTSNLQAFLAGALSSLFSAL
jgi:hypothetical protein